MDLYLMRTDPVQEIAAEPAALDALTAALSPHTQPPQAAPDLIAHHAVHGFGWPLVPDPALPPGIVHCRPAPTARLSEAEMEDIKARWLAMYGGRPGVAHPVVEVREEQT
ncbi:hypothetical protein [Streptomyces sp. NBC_01508]|uniref:hypothetical protein n=1 Tax=Streptomyces sp. NBC_01508 TaxID=2903888 RepID=UPI00386C1607